MPLGIAAGPDGNLWFTEELGNQIGRITPAGKITEFTLPTNCGDSTFGCQPFGITAGPDGNLWFAELNGNRIGRITPAGVITEFHLIAICVFSVGCGPDGITAGSDGNLWFTEFDGNAIGRITPSGSFSTFGIPTAKSRPEGITAGPDGNVWFVEENASKILLALRSCPGRAAGWKQLLARISWHGKQPTHHPGATRRTRSHDNYE